MLDLMKAVKAGYLFFEMVRSLGIFTIWIHEVFDCEFPGVRTSGSQTVAPRPARCMQEEFEVYAYY